jgi:polyphosphate kinase
LQNKQEGMAKNKKIINREISWLSFNERVLQEAANPDVPPIERIKFLGIFSNNLDEFFKVRVATLKRMIDFNKGIKHIDEENPKILLNKIQELVIKLQQKSQLIYLDILAVLEKENIYVINETQLTQTQRLFVEDYFDEHIMALLSPVMLSNVKKFPYLKDKSIYFAVKLENSQKKNKVDYAILEIPSGPVPRFFVLPSSDQKKYVILLDDVIRICLPKIFYIFNYDVFSAYTIKMTRDAELDIDSDLSVSFLEKISKSVRDRSKGQPVRFVYDATIPKDLLKYLTSKLKLDKSDNLIPGSRYHNFRDFISFPRFGKPSIEYPPAPPLHHQLIKPEESLISLIAQRDILLHYPYQKFGHLINFLQEAAIDPKVRSIQITLYRAAKNSKVINALVAAARNDKEVTVNIELQARFDESANISWSKKLEEVGVKVFFGVKGLKVHAKLILITRMENRKLVDYACISTGNFHEDNAYVYSDLAFFTSDKRITSEVRKVFMFLENTYLTFAYKHLLVSPLYMRRRLFHLIDNEINNARAGKEAYIDVKTNNLIDTEMVNKLYHANNEGVKIRLIVRGICSIVPGIKGLSENIEAVSIVDRYLEHSRIFIFANRGEELYYISSADWMTRNLDYRIEVACPIYDSDLKEELRFIFNKQWEDNVKARLLDAQLDNQIRQNGSTEKIRSQVELYHYYEAKLH